MAIVKQPDKINELLNRAVQEIVVKKDLERVLRSGKKLRVYFGIDPTSSRITLGNAVPLRKLRDFQDLGHEVIFLVGSFTALIGDTSDKESTRPPLAPAEIKKNLQDYQKQASKILDFNRTKIVYNGDWLSKLNLQDIIGLAQNFTVQQMIERDMYQKRLSAHKPIGLHEFLYPLMQGYDSVHLGVDVEVGGSDQLFNMLAGRTLLKVYKNKAKHVLTTPLLEGLDGRKMSKTFGNAIDLTDSSQEMFGKIMSLRDGLIIKYFELCTDVPLKDVLAVESELHAGANPRDAKMHLAREIVGLYYGAAASGRAGKEFTSVFQQGNKPTDMVEVKLSSLGKKRRCPPEADQPLAERIEDLLTKLKMIPSKSEAKRLVEQGGVRIDDKVIKDWKKEILVKEGMILQVGKRKFIKIV